ncbi:hypothetical protein VE03_06037 [Pseudogymnoascus sp. 23342-1-I1]|nr:hypothetical protein VE03_06037 [Pseudogymnoascus sp. 23342-1-I1]
MEVDDEDASPSEYRLQIGTQVKYLVVKPGTYDRDTLSFPFADLPPLQYDANWTVAHISRSAAGTLLTSLSTRKLAGVKSLTGAAYEAVPSLALAPILGITPGAPVIAKIACFPWETPRLEQETRIYRLLADSGLAPRFLGHVREGQRVIGFVLEKVAGRAAEVEDLGACEEVLGSLRALGKSAEVLSLLRSLPYIRSCDTGRMDLEGAPYTKFADYQQISQSISGATDLKIVTEGAAAYADVLPHAVGLTCGGRDNPVFLLDTELGIVYWAECYGEIMQDPGWNALMVLDDPCDFAPENEEDWRCSGPAWAVEDFFEILKDQFRMLHFVPQNRHWVLEDFSGAGVRRKGMIAMVQDVYREHGWPDLGRYRKRECVWKLWRRRCGSRILSLAFRRHCSCLVEAQRVGHPLGCGGDILDQVLNQPTQST